MSVENCGKRLDIYLTENALAPSREAAKKLIQGGYVTVGGKTVTKPSFLVLNDADVAVSQDNEITRYVSRGALKLEAALDSFEIDVKNVTAVDFGASTGGFTDLLLQRGASHVYAIENGVNQLHPKLLSDIRVTSFDNTNARYISKGFIPLCDIAVMDVSFISQTKLYESVTNVLKKDGVFISLIKPQFEAGKEHIGKNGIVKNSEVYQKVISDITEKASFYNLKLIQIIPSPILGGDGNKEFLSYFRFEG